MSRKRRGAGRGPRPAPRDQRLVAGVGPVSELLDRAPEQIVRVWTASGRKGGAAALAERARSLGVRVETTTVADLDARLGTGGRHQGIVAETHPYEYADLDQLVDIARERGEAPLIVCLDGVTDPHNLGAIARSAYLLGAHGLVIPRDRAAEVNPTATKVSAGAVEHLAIAQVTNLTRALAELKEAGVWIYGVAAAEGATGVAATDFTGPVALVLGAEGSGLRPLVAKSCDVSVVIPMRGSRVGSFNVSVAAALALYEVDRQRRAASST